MKIRLFSVVHFKNLAKSLARAVEGLPLAEAQEATARMLGFRNLHEALLFHKDADQLPSLKDDALSEPEREERQAYLTQRLADSLGLALPTAKSLVAALSPLSTRTSLVAIPDDYDAAAVFGHMLSGFRTLKECQRDGPILIGAALRILSSPVTLDPSDVIPFEDDNLVEDWQASLSSLDDLARSIYARPLFAPHWFWELWEIASSDDTTASESLRQQLMRVTIGQLRRAIAYAGRLGFRRARLGAIHTAHLVISQAAVMGWWELVVALSTEMASQVERLHGVGSGFFDPDTPAVEGFRMWRVVASVHLGNIHGARKIAAAVVRRGSVDSTLLAMSRIVQLDPVAPDMSIMQQVLADHDASGHILDMLATGMDDPLKDPIDVSIQFEVMCESAIAISSMQYLALVAGVPAWTKGFEREMRPAVIPVHRRLAG